MCLGQTYLLILESLPERQEATGTLFGGHRCQRQLFWGTRTTMRTLVLAAPFWNLPSSLLIPGAYLPTSQSAPFLGPCPPQAKQPAINIYGYRHTHQLVQDLTLPTSGVISTPGAPRQWPHSITSHDYPLNFCYLQPASPGSGPPHQPIGTSPRPYSQPCQDLALPTSSRQPPCEAGSAANCPGTSPTYWHIHSSWPHHNRRAQSAYIWGTLGHTSCDPRGVCCWVPKDVSWIRLLFEDEEI